MATVTGYITYVLLCINGEGHQPYAQVANSGMALEGGMYGINGRMLGYLIGDPDKVEDVVQSLAMYAAKRLSPEEAMDWVDRCTQVNSVVHDMMGKTEKYVGYACLDAEGRVSKPIMEGMTSVPSSPRSTKSPDLVSRVAELERRVLLLEGNENVKREPAG